LSANELALLPKPWRTMALYAILLLYVAVASLRQRGFIFDDPFIFFRYAEHLASGNGWHYNIGQSGADAATSPLYVVLLAVAAKVGFGIVGTAQVIFIGSLSGCACLTHAFLARLGHWWAGAGAAVLIVSSPAIFITRGMETTLFLAVVALCLYLWTIRATWSLGVALAMLVLIRPDGIVLAVGIVGARWVVDRRPPIRTLATGTLIGVLWSAYALATVGTLLPDTLTAKVAQGRSGFWGTGQIFVHGLFHTPQLYKFFLQASIVGVIAIAGAVCAYRRPELRLPLGVLTASTVVVAVAYAILNVPPYPWYYAPLFYVAAVFAGVALEALGGHLRSASPWLVALPVGMTLLLALFGTASTPLGPPRPGYIQAAMWIDRHTDSHASVASREIGLLGWETNHPIDDYLGLLTKNAIAPMEHGNMVWWVNGLRPDYWMTSVRPNRIDAQVREAPWFQHVFREVYRNAYVIIYKRVAEVPK